MARKKSDPKKNEPAEVDHEQVAALHQVTANLAFASGNPLAALAAMSAAALHRQEAKRSPKKTGKPAR
ncbi:MAG: hypothetical protein JO362_20285 [Streptomycetaceae bacterium]|nr:hypothetical protein [Streptomycetaceae bacterium]